jgi:hypothetical protein
MDRAARYSETKQTKGFSGSDLNIFAGESRTKIPNIYLPQGRQKPKQPSEARMRPRRARGSY